MQSYDGFHHIPRIFFIFVQSCCNTSGHFVTISRTFDIVVASNFFFALIFLFNSLFLCIFATQLIIMKMSKKQQYRSFSKRLTRRIMLALTLALIVVAAFFNWIEADVFTHYYKVYCKILLDVKNATIASASSSPSSQLCST